MVPYHDLCTIAQSVAARLAVNPQIHSQANGDCRFWIGDRFVTLSRTGDRKPNLRVNGEIASRASNPRVAVYEIVRFLEKLPPLAPLSGPQSRAMTIGIAAAKENV